MSFDVKTFRRALGCYATGITVVTGRDGDGLFGITINSFTSLSLEPPLVLFCLGVTSRHHTRLRGLDAFAVNVLSEDQGAVSMHFASPASQERWEGVAQIDREAGPPLLAGCIAHLDCTPEAFHDGGDHSIVVGRVQNLTWQADGQPLLYFRGRYGRLGELFVPVLAPADLPPNRAS